VADSATALCNFLETEEISSMKEITDVARCRPAQSRKRKLQMRKSVRLWLMIGIEAAVLLSLVLGVVALLNRNPLEGNWYDEDQLVYKFNKNGNGVQVVKDGLARFHYDIEDDTLYIDFISEEYEDCSYQFSVEDDTLYLQGIMDFVLTSK